VSQFLVTKEYIGFQETLDFLKKVFTEQGPFDGVLGFSQGGTLASIICALRQSIPEFKFNFAMIFSAFPTSVPEYNQLYKTIPADFHCLQSYGQGDTLIHATGSGYVLRKLVSPPVLLG
jgi:predicted esterase